jgi:hypothetical protein
MNPKQLNELLLQSLEHEMGGVQVYMTAVACAVNADLKKEWSHYLEQTSRHVEVMTKLCQAVGLDPGQETPGRGIVRQNGAALVAAMKKAQDAGDPASAQLVACEVVVLAETKDHADWELIGQCAQFAKDACDEALAGKLKEAYDQVEDEEDEHLYHTKGWCRELWLESLGLPAKLPPPEETRKVTSAISAAKVQAQSLAARHG